MLSGPDQLHWKAFKVANAVLVSLSCRQSAETLLEVANGEDGALWPPHNQDLFTAQIALLPCGRAAEVLGREPDSAGTARIASSQGCTTQPSL